MSAQIIDATKEVNTTVDAQKRAFMKKFGKYAIAGAGMATLMTPTLSSANNYCGGTGTVEHHADIPGTGKKYVDGQWDADVINNEDGWEAVLEADGNDYVITSSSIKTTDNPHAGYFWGRLSPGTDNMWHGSGQANFQNHTWSWKAVGDPSTGNIQWTYNCPM
jgi:hypothetical protein